MAYSTIKNTLTLSMQDERFTERTRIVELGGLVVVTDDDAERFNLASKSAVMRYVQNNYQRDPAVAPEAGSEVRDTLRLYFQMEDLATAHFDIPDPKDELFLATSGAGANILKDRADLALDLGGPGEAVDAIIGLCLSGGYLISDGETPEAFLGGERVTWR